MRAPAGRPLAGKDAVFLSPHKFPGGPGTPGILVLRRPLVRNRVPTVPGGGTITYVHATDQHYLDDAAHREEGGTPAIVESIRAGLVFQLKQAVGAAVIAEREGAFVRRAIRSWRANPAIELLGDLDADRANAFATQAVAGWLGIKPGWTRLSFSFYLSEAEFDYLVQAVHLVATHGHRLLGDYRFDPRSGLWRHRRAPLPLPGLHQFAFDPDLRPRHPNGGGHRRVSDRALADYLRTARAILAAHPDPDGDKQAPPVLPDPLERLRWFELPGGRLTGTR
jgi:hypothetical protein